MTISEFIYKVKRKLSYIKSGGYNQKPYEEYCKSYKCYKHSLQHTALPKYTNYIAARPNPGAGIGHQMANWMAGFHLAKVFNLRFAHIPFSNIQHPFVASKWDEYLGFGQNEILYKELLKKGYKKILLPLFKITDTNQLQIIKNIIQSYSDERVVFLLEQDQYYKDLQTLIPELKNKYYTAPARKNDVLIYNPNNYNIAIHVRRGDIMADPNNPNLAMRYLSNDYFEKVLIETINKIKSYKPIHIYFFSQGTPEDYPEFKKYKNLHWCLEMNAIDSFTHLVFADLIITSKSSFSYKPALLNQGIKVCPQNFWHGYPISSDWIMVDNDGNINWK